MAPFGHLTIKKDRVPSGPMYVLNSREPLILLNWRDCLGIEPSYPGTQDTSGFEDRGGHQYPNQPRKKNRVHNC
jgi:hypothetical protein